MTTLVHPQPHLELARLYLVRAAVAVVWAGAVFLLAGDGIGPLLAALLVLYPLLDVAALVRDARTQEPSGRPVVLLNVALSTLAAIAVGVAATSGTTAVLRVWGVWAIVAGATQLVVGIVRRRGGGQVPMMLSGGLSVLVGGSFLSGAADLRSVAGYAVAGAVFFAISALRLRTRSS
jgi:uncharacterized membrane protein HdeD (DUF308 family)